MQSYVLFGIFQVGLKGKGQVDCRSKLTLQQLIRSTIPVQPGGHGFDAPGWRLKEELKPWKRFQTACTMAREAAMVFVFGLFVKKRAGGSP